MEASKKKMKFPSAFSILFIILLIAIGLTWLIPSGSYSKLSYDTTENHFIVKPINALNNTKKALPI